MTMFAYRSEAPIDSDSFLAEIRRQGHSVSEERSETVDFDLLAEFVSDAGLDELVAIASGVVDGHIIVRTLREGTIEGSDLGEYVRTE